MGAAAVTAPPPATADRGRGTDRALAGQAFRQVRVAAGAWAVVFGVTIASSAVTYANTYPTVAARQQIAATTSGDRGLAVLLGPISAIDTIGGYTVYKAFVFLTTVGAIWAVLAATRVLRGAEDAGRWQLGLAGATTPRRATLATLAALVAAVGVLFVGTTAITLLAARDPKLDMGAGATVLYGASLALVPLVFVAVGAVTSQLGRTRRVATSLGMGVFAVAFVIRMVADAGPRTEWLRWATPFGWTELMAPYTHNDPWPLVPALVTALVLGALAAGLAARRDVGDGLLASADVAPLRPAGLSSATGLSARLEWGVLAGWCAGAVAAALVLGIVGKLTSASIPASMRDTLDKFGVQGSFVNQYFGVAFLLVATVVTLLPAGQIGAAADEETSGRLVHVLVRSAGRTGWFAGRLALTAGAVLVSGVLAGVATWVGARSQGVEVGFGTMVWAGANVVPTAWVALGIGAVTLAVAPRAAAIVVYAVVIWSVVVDLLGSLVASLGWLDHLTLFHYMALAPAQHPRASNLAITTVVAAALCGLGAVLFDRRDVHLG